MKSCLTFWTSPSFFLSFLHPRSFERFKFKFEKFNNNFPCINDFKWKLCQQVSCTTLLGLELFFSSFLHPRSFEKFKFKTWKNLKQLYLFEIYIFWFLVISPSKVVWKINQILISILHYSALIYRAIWTMENMSSPYKAACFGNHLYRCLPYILVRDMPPT
jgi:hypothetical protein